MFSKSVGMRRRGSVLILVVGVLAMLFVIGATQLMVARSERKLAVEKGLRTDAMDASQSSVVPTAATVNEDIKGLDSLAYSRGWSAAETSPVEDSNDFLGVATVGTASQRIIRNGDLTLSSLEPYFITGEGWQYYFLSWKLDTITALSGWPVATPRWPAPWTLNAARLNHDYADSDGDGVADSQFIGVIAGCEVYVRVVPNGGMVLLDRMTHPSLLAQIIHPADGGLHLQPWQLFNPAGFNWSPSEGEESRLRRRFILPGSHKPGNTDWNALPTNDLRKLLPVTLGHTSPVSAYDSITPHWYRVAAPGTDQPTEQSWFKARMTPGVPLAVATVAQKTSDMYDRRHLMTTRSNDDLLRPDRDEKGLLANAAGVRNEILSPVVTVATDPPSMYYVLNPDSTPTTVNGLDTWGRNPLSTAPVPMAYGINANSGTSALEFNKPGLRTPFSLRDVLVPPVTTGGYQASYRRAIQLTAYYLAMLRHQVTSYTVPATTPGSLPSDEVLLRQAAQLAVNTIDFADNNDINGNRVQETGETDYPSRLHLTYTTSGGPIDIDVCGIEKQPYITEAYAKVAEVYDQGVGPFTKNPDPTGNIHYAKSLYAVEIYNPYRTQLDLSGIVLRTAGADYPLDTALANAGRANTFMNAGEVLIFANTNLDPTASTVLNPPFDGSNPANLIVVSGLKIVNTEPVQLLQTKVVRLDPPSTAVAYNGDSVLETLPTSGASVTAIILDEMGKSTPGTYNLHQSESPYVNTSLAATDGMALSGDDFAAPLNLGSVPVSGTYWRHTSLQRRKEDVSSHPIAWHFTMARQAGFESKNVSNAAVEQQPVHGLTGGLAPKWGYLVETDLAQGCGSATCTGVGQFPNSALRFQDIPPLMLVTSDLGFDWTTTNLGLTPPLVGTAAFPTTGSLLLVSRDGHRSFNGNVCVNLGDKAADYFEVKPGDLADFITQTAVMFGKGIDFGHMPVFDVRRNIPTVPATHPKYGLYTAAQTRMTTEVTSDLAEQAGRMDVPWGQMVFHYFTALPLEELTQTRYSGAANMVAFENTYMQDFGQTVSGSSFSYYPLVEPVTEASSRFGPRVRGRVNVNLAPWWVMDGLPVLRGDYVPNAVADKPVYGLPVGDILCSASASYLDPDPSLIDNTTTWAGRDFQSLLMEDAAYLTGPVDRTISPTLAQHLEAYRELRTVTGFTTQTLPANPGYTTVGSICDLVANVPVTVAYKGQALAPTAVPYVLVRAYQDPTVSAPTFNTLKPFSYIGYMQMIAPVVRLEDWATVKTHVYTVYNLVGDGNGTWLRSQTTIDRTRCLYTNDLPERIVQTEPMDYFNTVSDQQ